MILTGILLEPYLCVQEFLRIVHRAGCSGHGIFTAVQCYFCRALYVRGNKYILQVGDAVLHIAVMVLYVDLLFCFCAGYMRLYQQGCVVNYKRVDKSL
jgi:hypothetical protein